MIARKRGRVWDRGDFETSCSISHAGIGLEEQRSHQMKWERQMIEKFQKN
jgi:hypothetical protein